MNLFDYLLSYPDEEKIAIASREGQVSYGELRKMAEQFAYELSKLGISKGERVAILAENSPFWVASYLAILKIAAIAVPIPQRVSSETFQKLIELMDIQAFCMDEPRLANFGSDLPQGAKLVLPHEPQSHEMIPTIEVDEKHDLAALMFTSGSSGQPNAVKISHRNIMANTESILSYLELRADDSIMVVLPFDYCFGTSLLHSHLRVGAKLVLNKSFSFIETVLEDMSNFQVTGFAGVPTVYQHLLRGTSLSRYPLPHLRYAQQAGGRLPDIFIRQFTEALPHVKFFVMYGQTEATARLSYLPPEKLHEKLGSIGCGIPDIRIELLDKNGQAVEAGGIGEIVASGDNIALGYWIPDPSKQPFRDGKLYTGDIAQMDKDGFLYIVGRNSEFLKLNGHRVGSSEIEEVLFSLPDVLEAAVIAYNDPHFGESAKAFLVLRKNASISMEMVLRHCKKELPAYAIPRTIEFLTELPKNPSGKILKSVLRSLNG